MMVRITRVGSLCLALAAAGCAPRPAPAAHATVAAGNDPIGAERGALDGQRSCADSCCLPHADQFSFRVAPADAEAARRTLASATDPRVIALALRILTPVAEVDDAPALARRIDDARDGGELPSVLITQQMMPCYPVSWQPARVADEALHALSHAHGTQFADAAAYRAWAAAHPDPELTFDFWYARLDRQRPPEAGLLARLRSHDAVLVARVMAAYCDATDSCGVTRAQLVELLRNAGGGDRVVRWLTGEERFPEWEHAQVFHAVVASVIRGGESLFGDTHYPALERVMRAPGLPAYLRARLAVLLGRLRPAQAQKLWSWALHDLDGGYDAVLHEAAAREPVAFADTLARWFYGGAVPTTTGPAAPAQAILEGLADAGPRGAPTFKRLIKTHAVAATDEDVVPAAAAAARASGCAGVPEADQLRFHGTKNARPEYDQLEHARVNQLRTDVIERIRACLPRLP